MRKDDDAEILQAALVGYQQQLQTINARIAELKRHLGGRGAAPAATASDSRPAQKRHRISAEGRARIAAAQRKRWAAAKKRNN